jgi:hypothetical protein
MIESYQRYMHQMQNQQQMHNAMIFNHQMNMFRQKTTFPPPCYNPNVNNCHYMQPAPQKISNNVDKKLAHDDLKDNLNSQQTFKVPPVPKRLNLPQKFEKNVESPVQHKSDAKRQKTHSNEKCNNHVISMNSSNDVEENKVTKPSPPPVPASRRNLSSIFARLKLNKQVQETSLNPFRNPSILKELNECFYLDETFDSSDESDLMSTSRFSETNPFVEENNIEPVTIPALASIKKFNVRACSPDLWSYRKRSILSPDD